MSKNYLGPFEGEHDSSRLQLITKLNIISIYKST